MDALGAGQRERSGESKMGQLDFGIWDALRPYEINHAASAADVYDQHIRLVQLMEQVGYSYYWIIEHQASYIGAITAPSVYLTAVARATERIHFGAMIWQVPFHNPMRLAEEIATIDHLSRGRVEFGAGIGTHEHEFIRMGLDYYQRREMGEEALAIMEKAWTQPEVTYNGRFWQFDEMLPMPKPYQQPHPPIWIAAHSLRAFEWAAERNNDVATNISTDDEMEEKFAHYRKIWAECEHPGPMPRQLLVRPVHVAETEEKAHEEAREYILKFYSLGREMVTDTRVGFGTDPRGKGGDNTRYSRANGRIFRESGQSYDFWLDNGLALVGTPESVTRQIKASQKRLGYTVFVSSHHLGAMPPDMVERSIKLFGEEVIPAFEKPAVPYQRPTSLVGIGGAKGEGPWGGAPNGKKSGEAGF
jgi:alkanesulfonate monooxygenase SsuD/methylene tetrahydromethanopterin reductase-like flavin-dependent oxidoreductase (luciferase family)